MTSTDLGGSRTSAAYRAAINLADTKFGSQAAMRRGASGFYEALISVRRLALSIDGTDQGRALATHFAQRVELSGPEHVAFVTHALPNENEHQAQRFEDRTHGMHAEAAHAFMTVAGLSTEHVAPVDYPTLSRYYLHVLNLRMGA
jgi:hypothetical protein